ncbi:uncharacterized protein LOC108930807 [Scleropages formosus]|uniref:Uncharacterized LOC108930807 n=1 Tax=Scleropages formosus TaxID=113540 RepID=A0A8C9SHL0_SCLFO|nr:uncharacterized protein LOC108930807 [Scleropages formosus]
MCLLLATAVLTLLSTSFAGPLHCEDSVKQLFLKDLNSIKGKWIFISGTTTHQKYASILQVVNSSWVEFSPTSQNEICIFNQGNMINGTCHYSSANLTFLNSTFTVTHENATSTGILLHTCPDCLLMSFITLDNGEMIQSFYILGRAKKLSISDLEAFNRQAKCLGFPEAPFMYDGETEMCPPTQEHATTENPAKVKDESSK